MFSLVFLFAMASFTQVNAITGKEYILEVTMYEDEGDCWDEADAAEEDYCGSVGCSTEFWLGYMDSCMG